MEVRWNLPPSRSIIALESVVRTGSVTAAANELCVTQSAVSKQIASLEAWLGQPLFEDNRRRMVPTRTAQRLAEVTGEAWDLLAAAFEEVAAQSSSTELGVLAPASFAMRWLLPRLPLFQADCPAIKLSVRQTHTRDNWKEMPTDVVIRRGDSAPAALSPKTFLRDELVLVAKAGSDWTSAGRPGDLAFLEAETRPGELAAWLRAWRATTRDGYATSTRMPTRFAHYYIALEAALAGHGALVAPDVVVADLIKDGSLSILFPDIRVQGATYWVGVQPNGPRAREAHAFASWLVADAWAPASGARSSVLAIPSAA